VRSIGAGGNDPLLWLLPGRCQDAISWRLPFTDWVNRACIGVLPAEGNTVGNPQIPLNVLVLVP